MDYPKSVPNVGLVNGKFIDENTATGQVGSLIPSVWGNSITDELLALIKAAELVPSESNNAQVLEAISVLLLKLLRDQKQSSANDTTPGKLLTVGAFGLGANGGGAVVALDATFVPGFYRYGASDPSAPPGTNGSGGSLLVLSAGGNFIQQLVIVAPGATSKPYIGVRCFDSAGTPGSFVSIYNAGNLGASTEPVAGILKIATQVQIDAGTDDSTAITPKKLAAWFGAKAATEAAAGIVKIATQGQADAGADDSTAITPKKLAAWFGAKAATEAAAGIIKIATQGQTDAGVDDSTAVTPKKLSAKISSVDPWSMQPVGVPVPLRDDLPGVASPPTTNAYRYIKLTASDSYNTGALAGESVTGTAPLVIATAVISLAGSPLNGRTINLINTERRALRAGSSGTVEQDAFPSHGHSELVGSPNVASSTTDTTASFAAGLSAAGAYSQRLPTAGTINNVVIGAPIADASGGAVRLSNETRVKSIGVTYYMRIK